MLVLGISMNAQKKIYNIEPSGPANIGQRCNVTGPVWNNDCVTFTIRCTNMADFITVTNCGSCCKVNYNVIGRGTSQTVNNPIEVMVLEGAPLIDPLTISEVETGIILVVESPTTFEDDEKIINFAAGDYQIETSKLKLKISRVD
jgi:hypothetical protein